MTTRAAGGLPVGRDRRRGFSLIEITVVMGVLGVVLFLGGAALVGALKLERTATAAFHRQTVRTLLADKFRLDVAEAADAPDAGDDVKAGPTCLLLRLGDGRHVVYRWDNDRLERSEQTDSGTTRQYLPVGREGTTVEFLRTGPDRRLVILRLHEPAGVGGPARPFDLAAALGGDLR